MIDVNDQNYDVVIKDNDVVLLDFHAEWCGPCQAMTPVLEKVEVIARERGQQLVIGRVDTGTEVELAQRFKVSALPTLIFIKDGKEVHRHLGMAGAAELSDVVDGFFDNSFDAPEASDAGQL